jgi:uncharacterized protein YndB with AHSA1/START domain
LPHLEDSVVVDRPIDDVWAYLTDLFNAPRLFGRHVLGIRQTSAGSPGVGSTLQGRMVVFGFETRLKFVITEWDPPHVLAFSGAIRPFRSGLARWTLETIGNGTKMVRSADVELPGALRLVWPFIRPVFVRGMRSTTRNLKQFIEAKPR